MDFKIPLFKNKKNGQFTAVFSKKQFVDLKKNPKYIHIRECDFLE
jgi:hypothetical protein